MLCAEKKNTWSETVEMKLEVNMRERKILSQSAVRSEIMKNLEK